MVSRISWRERFVRAQDPKPGYQGENLRSVRALVAYEQLAAWCEGNPAVSAPSGEAAVNKICDQALNNYYIDDAVIEATRRACLAKIRR